MILKDRKIALLLSFLIFLMFCLGPLQSRLYAIPAVQKTILPNQLVVLYSKEHSLPFVTFQLLIDAGSSRDPAKEAGLSQITAKGLLMGTPNHSLTALNEELDFMGASLDASSGRDYATLTLRILKKDLDKALDIFMEVLTQPTFPETEIRREVERTLAAIQSAEDQPGWVAEREFQKALFLEGPYRHSIEGTKESLPQITRNSIVRFFETFYHPNRAILTVVGDITYDEIKTKLFPRLEKWPKGQIPKMDFESTLAKGIKTIKMDRKITQANIILGHGGVNRGNPDFYALTVMNYIFGGGDFASRLTEEIRNKRGLAYSVDSFFDPGKYPGSFQIVLQTKNASAQDAISIALQQMRRIREQRVSEEELDGAKKYLIGSFPMRLDTQGKLANFLTQVEYYGLGLNYPEKYRSLIGSITTEEVLRVAKTYLHPENYILVIVANMKETGME
jgi:zinc protease